MAAPKKKKKKSQKSKAAQATAATRTERRAERRAQAIEAHPDAIEFKGKGGSITKIRDRVQPELSEEETRRRSIRNGIWMAILVGGASIWTLWFLMTSVR